MCIDKVDTLIIQCYMPYMKTILLSLFALSFFVTPMSDPQCGVCGYPMMFTGRTALNPNTSKMMHEYKCLKGHVAWVVVQ